MSNYVNELENQLKELNTRLDNFQKDIYDLGSKVDFLETKTQNKVEEFTEFKNKLKQALGGS